MRIVVGVLVLGLAFAGVHRVVRGGWPRPRRRMVSDLAYLALVDPLAKLGVQGVLGVPLVLGCFALGIGRPEVGAGFGPLAQLPDGLQLGLMLALADFLGYWSHRAFHTVPALWRFHAVHHSAPRLDWLAAARVHPVNEIVQRSLIAAPLLLLGFEARTFAALAPILTLHALVLHADVPWTYGRVGRWLTSPRFHRDHHARGAGVVNLGGLTPLWDRVFGTARFSDVEPTAFGVEEDVPDGVLGSLWWPFSRGGASDAHELRRRDPAELGR